MKAISIKLPEPLFHDLVQRAHDSAASQSEVVRQALQAYLHTEAGQRGSTASCASRASRWAGLVSGSSDLSSNHEHLEGFGQ